MGVKTALLAYTSGQPGRLWTGLDREGSRDSRGGSVQPLRSDRDAARELLRRVFPYRTLDDAGDDALTSAMYPVDEGIAYAGVFPGVSIVGSRLLASDYPSAVSSHVLDAAEDGCEVRLHSFHSVTDRLSFAVWRDRRLVRSLSLAGDGGHILEDLGDRLPFESPYWSGEHLFDDCPYAVPFHPGELCETAMGELFGFTVESGTYPVDLDAVVLNGFRLGEIGSAGVRGALHLVRSENGSVLLNPLPDQLRRLVTGLGPGNDYLVYGLRHDLIADADTAYFIQTYRHTGEGYFDVEYRVGAADHHFATTMESAEEVTAALVGWRTADMGWVSDYTWTTPLA